MTLSAEQEARNLLERMGIDDAQSFSAGDLVELANLIAAKPCDEASIRNAERHHIAHLLEQHGDTLVSYLSDPRDAVKLIAYLLRLEANREAEQ